MGPLFVFVACHEGFALWRRVPPVPERYSPASGEGVV